MGSQTLFLIGAGFNCDAWCQFDGTTYTYPLVPDLLRPCFGLDQMPVGMSVEDLFQKAIDGNDTKPVHELTELLLEADHYIVGALRKGRNVYRLFLEHFSKSEFLTLNYDGLLEALLIDLGRWCPQDGFGPSDWISRSECIGIKPAERGSSAPRLASCICTDPCTFTAQNVQLRAMCFS